MNRTVIRAAFALACLAAVGASLAFVRTATSDEPAGPVGTYQIAAAPAGQSSTVYKLDTRTGQLWECGKVVFSVQPAVAGTGCLEVPAGFKPMQQ